MERGFTFVELLLSMAILTILFGLGIPSYRSFQANQQLSQVAETLKTNLRFAQSQALGGVKNANCTSMTPLAGWYIKTTATSYTIHSRCFSTSAPDPSPVSFRSVSLPTGTTLGVTTVPSSSATDVLFQPVNRDVVFLSDAGTGDPPFTSLADELRFTLSKSGRSVTIIIRKTGDIYGTTAPITPAPTRAPTPTPPSTPIIRFPIIRFPIIRFPIIAPTPTPRP